MLKTIKILLVQLRKRFFPSPSMDWVDMKSRFDFEHSKDGFSRDWKGEQEETAPKKYKVKIFLSNGLVSQYETLGDEKPLGWMIENKKDTYIGYNGDNSTEIRIDDIVMIEKELIE